MTKITVRSEEFKINYKDRILKSVFVKRDTDVDFESMLCKYNTENIKSDFIDKTRQTLLIACNDLKENSLIDAIKEKADEGIRIYLLLGDEKQNHEVIDTLSGRCLIRTGVPQQGALLLVDHGSFNANGLIINSNESLINFNSFVWGITLENKQIDDSFRSFSKLFWENSKNEYIEQNKQRESVVHPDGEIITNHSHHLFNKLLNSVNESIENLEGASNLYIKIDNEKIPLLINVKNKYNKDSCREGIALTDQSIPIMLLSEKGNWLIPDDNDDSKVNWCLKFSNEQSKDIKEKFNDIMSEAAWTFNTAIKLADLPETQEVRFSKQPDEIQSVYSNYSKKLQDIYVPNIDNFIKETAENLSSDFIQPDQEELSHEINYKVNIHPPYAPPQAFPDSLYKEWKDAENSWINILEYLQNLLMKIEDQYSNIGVKIKNYINDFLLGDKQKSKKLYQEIENLKAWSVLKATPAERKEYHERLIHLEKEIYHREKTTKTKLLEAKSHEEWEEKNHDLEKKEIACESLIEESEEKLKQCKNLGFLKIEERKNNFYSRWRQARKNAKNLTDADSKHLEAIDDGKIVDFKKIQIWKSSIKDKVWKKHYKDFDRVLADFEQEKNKIQRDIKDIESDIRNKKIELSSIKLEQDKVGKEFIYQEQPDSNALEKQLGIKSKEFSKVKFEWPNEELPAEGMELLSFKQKRFLVILNLEQLEKAREDANRLNAEIVCKKEDICA